ncbi:MAG TPA: ScyD/ScyE family protein, partial [Microthrixaceae bacterium]|nr:ScyD/ScyE family protein [Microthrixaceae bacterium]
MSTSRDRRARRRTRRTGPGLGRRTGPGLGRRLVAAFAAISIAIATTAVAGTAVAGAGSAGGGGPGGPGGGQPRVTTLARGLVGPLHLDVSPGWMGPSVLVSQSFAGSISRLTKDGVTDIVTSPGAFTGGVAAGPFGTVMYLIGDDSGTFLKLRLPNGNTRTIADLGAYEKANNPDQINHYGLQGATPECIAQLPPELPIAPYTGEVDSNPYELTVTPFGTYVADAGGNDILFVEWTGRIRTVSVLPPRPMVIPPEATALGVPACAIGLTMNFEPVPTDVEFGPDHQLYVSSLPGGPEDASLGARGGVFRVNPNSGRSKLIGSGFLGASNLAVAPNGTVYVAELFGNRVSRLCNGGPVPVA